MLTVLPHPVMAIILIVRVSSRPLFAEELELG